MSPISKARTAEVRTPEGWKRVSMQQLQAGDRFRLLKPDGTVVQGQGGRTEYVATAAAKPRPEEMKQKVAKTFSGLFRPTAVAA